MTSPAEPGGSRPTRPNILFIMSDDHAAHAISSYGSRINRTPHIDRIAADGMRLDATFCVNAICAPSRASIMTGTHSHVNGVTTLATGLDNRQVMVPGLMQAAGYQTAVIGKWHLGHGPRYDPVGFDYWSVLPEQGEYYDPELIEMGTTRTHPGYATDIITDLSLRWLRDRDPTRPFLLMCHHKAPHRPWQPDHKHQQMYQDIEIPEPDTLWDDYANRSRAAREAKLRIESNLYAHDLKQPVPAGLSAEQEKSWKYQRYIKDYLRCVASMDDNIGRLLDHLDESGQTRDTIVIYTSDQGFFLGDHGWYDKRFMYEESIRMPLLVRYPPEIAAGSVNRDLVTNLDFAPTLLDYAGIDAPAHMQGRSFRDLLRSHPPADWPTAFYYRYWMHLAHHHVPAHYGIRTQRHKLIYYYGQPLDQPGSLDQPTEPEWELFDLDRDPQELRDVYHDPAYATVVRRLTDELHRLQAEAGDLPPPSAPAG